jgi:hypothetical protein
MNCYLIRLQKPTTEQIDYCLKNEIVGIGYKEISHTKYKGYKNLSLTDEINKFYYQFDTLVKQQIFLNLEKFIKINNDDFVILVSNENIFISIATHDRIYDYEISENIGLYNQIYVNYLKENNTIRKFSLNSFSIELQNLLNNSDLLIYEISEYLDEINSLIKIKNC